MSDGNVIKFGKAKKAMARSQRNKQAEENRIKFGRTKIQKKRDESALNKHTRHVENHKIDE